MIRTAKTCETYIQMFKGMTGRKGYLNVDGNVSQ